MQDKNPSLDSAWEGITVARDLRVSRETIYQAGGGINVIFDGITEEDGLCRA